MTANTSHPVTTSYRPRRRVKSLSCWQAAPCATLHPRGIEGDPLKQPPIPKRLQLGGDDFVAASAFVRQLEGQAGWAARLFVLARRPREVVRLLRLLRGLPQIEIRLTESVSGRSLRAHFGSRRLGVPLRRVGQAVLVMPPDLAAYLRGRSRQALRTNLTKARSAGFTCSEVVDDEERRQIANVIYAQRPDDPHNDWSQEPRLQHRGDRWFVCWDSSPTPAALAVVAVDAEFAYLRLLLSADGPNLASSARYLLHTHVVEALIAERVGKLAVGNSLRITPGLQHFQRLLGYQVYNLRLTD